MGLTKDYVKQPDTVKEKRKRKEGGRGGKGREGKGRERSGGNPSTFRVEEEDEKLKIISGYTESSKPGSIKPKVRALSSATTSLARLPSPPIPPTAA